MGKKIEPKRQQNHKKNTPTIETVSYQGKWKYYSVLAIILLVSFFAYFPVLHNGLLGWDDDGYIKNNPLIYSFNLKEIFSHNVLSNYHPFTILILAVEYHFFGLNATGYHAVNLFFHLLNVIFVFYAVFLLSDKVGVALVASLLFGIHPMHVESVAWVAELKDLLYTFFFLASYIFYLKYIKDRQKKFYVFALLLFLVSLLSKAMAASLPLVLILTDYFKGRKINTKILLEKVPFFLLAVIFGVVAVVAQKTSGAISDLVFTVPQRIAFACYGFITYLIKLILPINLCAFYPYPPVIAEAISFSYYAYVLLFTGLTIFVFYSARFSKKIIFSIGFFTITVFLVLQLLPVGNAVIADRYSYIPSIGIFYLAGEGFMLLWNNKIKWIPIILLVAFTGFFSVKTYTRCQVWNNDISLWNDVISQYQTIPFAYNNRGTGFMNLKEYDRAQEDYGKAIVLKPNYTNAYYNRGIIFIYEKEYDKALNDFNKVIELNPKYSEAYTNRGNVLRDCNRDDEALKDYNKAIELNPIFSNAYFNRGALFMKIKRNNEALNDFNKAIELKPTYVQAFINRGIVFYREKRYEDAINNQTKAIELQANAAPAYYNRGLAEYYSGKKDAAILDMKQAASLGYKPAIGALNQIEPEK